MAANLFDKLNKELEDFGQKAREAFDEGRQRLELMRYRRKLDNAARDLGLMVHQDKRGDTKIDKAARDSLLDRMDGLKTKIQEIESELKAHGVEATVEEEPAPDAETAEAEVVEEEEKKEKEIND